jgi:hypothetical protein
MSASTFPLVPACIEVYEDLPLARLYRNHRRHRHPGQSASPGVVDPQQARLTYLAGLPLPAVRPSGDLTVCYRDYQDESTQVSRLSGDIRSCPVSIGRPSRCRWVGI